MPELNENVAYWDGDFNWRQGGDEWSEWWGGPRAQWRATIYPRVKEFLPARRVLEIAPGYGRWTQFLRHHCDELIGIDLSAECIEACRLRFRRDRRLSFHANDGKSLAAVQDGTVDFVFSFDSLVHVEQDVMDAYLAELARVLSVDGVGFLHHSNMAAYATEDGQPIPHWRARSVSAETVAQSAADVGLNCFRQELVAWGADHEFLNDSFTWIARAHSTHDRPREVIANATFMEEAHQALGHAIRWRRYGVRNAKRAATSALVRLARRWHPR
jgi:ubiquinone/menaquinone biosynthesis C-methylase UbiE